MVWWRRSEKDPTADGDAPSVFSLDSGSLSAADTSLAESSSGRSSGGDAPGPTLSAPPAPMADSCRLTPDVVTAFEHGLDMPVAALSESCTSGRHGDHAGCPDVVLCAARQNGLSLIFADHVFMADEELLNLAGADCVVDDVKKRPPQTAEKLTFSQAPRDFSKPDKRP